MIAMLASPPDWLRRSPFSDVPRTSCEQIVKIAMLPAWLNFDNGAGCRIRTRDLRFTKPLLYQLS